MLAILTDERPAVSRLFQVLGRAPNAFNSLARGFYTEDGASAILKRTEIC